MVADKLNKIMNEEDFEVTPQTQMLTHTENYGEISLFDLIEAYVKYSQILDQDYNDIKTMALTRISENEAEKDYIRYATIIKRINVSPRELEDDGTIFFNINAEFPINFSAMLTLRKKDNKRKAQEYDSGILLSSNEEYELVFEHGNEEDSTDLLLSQIYAEFVYLDYLYDYLKRRMYLQKEVNCNVYAGGRTGYKLNIRSGYHFSVSDSERELFGVNITSPLYIHESEFKYEPSVFEKEPLWALKSLFVDVNDLPQIDKESDSITRLAGLDYSFLKEKLKEKGYASSESYQLEYQDDDDISYYTYFVQNSEQELIEVNPSSIEEEDGMVILTFYDDSTIRIPKTSLIAVKGNLSHNQGRICEAGKILNRK